MLCRKVVGEWIEGEAGRGAERLAVGACVDRTGEGVDASVVSRSGAFTARVAVSPLDVDCAGPSRTEGSEGRGPSIAHRRVSYFERMKDSILL